MKTLHLSIIITGTVFATVFGIGMMFIDANAISSTNETQFQLKVNQTFSIESYGITVKFLNVISDSRCPSDVTCIWQGEAKVRINMIENNQDRGNFILSTLAGHNQIVFGTHTLHLMQVNPFVSSTKKISSNDYVITLVMLGGYVEPPLTQFNSGITAKNVICANGLALVIKAEDGSPACVRPETAHILIKRSWASSIITTPPTVQQTSGNTIHDSFEPYDTRYSQSNTGVAILYMPTNSFEKIREDLKQIGLKY